MTKLIIGFPGLSLSEETGRLEEISKQIPDHEFIKINYLGIKQERKTIQIPFSVEEFSKQVIIPKGYDELGIITSSTGAAVFSHYLESNSELKPKWCVSISPFCKLNPNARSQVKALYENHSDLEISEEQDTIQGRKRIIPSKYLRNILSLDINSKIDGVKIPHVLTLLGNQDRIIDFLEGKKYHFKIGGIKKNLVTYNTGHSLNQESIQRVIEFIKTIK